MSYALGTSRRTSEVERAIEQQVLQRSGGRIYGLEVEVTEEHVLVRGRARSHYVKQLALEGVLDIIGTLQGSQIDLAIEVGGQGR